MSTLFPLTYLSSHASVASRMSFSWPGLIGSRQTPCPPQTHIILTGTPLAASICALVTDCCSGNKPSAVPWISSVGAVMLLTRSAGPLRVSKASWLGVRMPSTSPVMTPE